MDDSPTSREKNLRRNLRKFLTELGFKDDSESRKLDPWMIETLARQENPQQTDSAQDRNDLNQESPVVQQPNPNDHHLSRKPSTSGGGIEEHDNTPIELPLEVRKKIMMEMHGYSLGLLIQKELTVEDVSPDKNRLLIIIPPKDGKEESQGPQCSGCLPVKIMVFNHDYDSNNQCGTEYLNMNMLNNYTYELNRFWYSIVQKYQLKEHMVVQLWSFLVDSVIHLALIKLQDTPISLINQRLCNMHLHGD